MAILNEGNLFTAEDAKIAEKIEKINI